MSSFRKLTSVALVIVAAGSMWFWLGGCDFTPVDEGANVSASDHIRALATATEPAAAEKAIRRVLAKVGANAEQRPGAETSEYFGFSFSDDAIRRVAEAQASFNKGDRTVGYPAADVYGILQAASSGEQVQNLKIEGMPVELSDALTALRISAQRAKATPESPRSALLLTVVSGAEGVPAKVPTFDRTHVFSPAQGLLFGMWLHQERARIPAFTAESSTKSGQGNPNASCPAGQVLLAKFNWSGNSYVFEKPAGNENVVSLVGDASSADWESTQPVFTVIIKGGQETFDYTPEGGATSGTIENGGIDDKDISNVQFCGDEEPPPPPDCYEECELELVACLLGCETSDDGQACRVACRAEARECAQSCHDQGETKTNWFTL